MLGRFYIRRRRQPLKVMSVLTYIAVVLVGQAAFGAMCGVALLTLAAAFRIWPSKLLREQTGDSSESAKTSVIDHPDELEEFLSGEYADLSR